jgi:anti-sigma factor RsiW
MEKIANAPGCARANDLVAFLYDETNEHEGRDFELHLQDCSECKSEFLGFRQIRQSVVAWRDEFLGAIPSSVVGSNTLAVSAELRPVPQEKGSAVAAVRQFFALSPLWMKGVVAFASVLFCVVAFLAVSHLRENPRPASVANERLYTEKELRAKIEERIQSLAHLDGRLAHLDGRKDEVPPAANVVTINRQQGANRRLVRPLVARAFDSPRARQRPLTKSEREQLAADLRLTSPIEEEGLDLFDDTLSK